MGALVVWSLIAVGGISIAVGAARDLRDVWRDLRRPIP